MTELAFNDQNFETEVLKSELPVLIDFWAEWCGPCKAQGPIIEELAGEFAGKAKVGKISVEESPNAAQKYGIMSIPALKIFKGGKVVWEAVGLQPKTKLVGELKKYL